MTRSTSPIHLASLRFSLAAANGRREVVDLLIRSKANIDQVDEDGLTALMAASAAGHADVVQLLVDAGADLSRSDSSASIGAAPRRLERRR